MSIIYEALKKVEGRHKCENRAEGDKSRKDYRRIKLMRFGSGVLLLAVLSAVPLFSKRAAVKNHHDLKNRRSAGQERLKGARLTAHGKKSDQNIEGREYDLQGILYTQDSPIALINGRRLAEGDKIEKATVKEISKDGVELSTGKENIYLALE